MAFFPSLWQPDFTSFDSLEGPAHWCRSTTPQTFVMANSRFLHSRILTIANRNIFWYLIFLPVGQKDFSMGILAVTLCMLNFLPGWNWSLVLSVFLCVSTYTKSSKWAKTFKWVKIFECHLHCCMKISYLEAYGPAVISQANLNLKFYISIGEQK